MADPYTPVTVLNYNLNPPPDDGTEVPSNEVAWNKHINKIGDPLKDAIESIDANLTAAFAKLLGGGGVTAVADDYTVLASDQGKLVKMSVAAKTITTPSAVVVGAPFLFAVLNNSSGDLTIDGSGAQTIDGLATLSVPSRRGLMLWTDGSNWFSSGVNWQEEVITPPQGRLTLTTLTPVLAAGVVAGTSVFYTPYTGNKVPLYNGSRYVPTTFAELTLALASQHVASSIYDVFVFLDSTTVRVGTGPAWTTVTAGAGARGTGAGTTELERVGGLWTNKVSMTARNGASTYTVGVNAGIYVGSIFMDGTNGQISCLPAYGQARKWGVWNAYNRNPIFLQGGDAEASWTYDVATIRQSRAQAGNAVTTFMGLPEEYLLIDFLQTMGSSNGAVLDEIGIGKNSTTVYSGQVGRNTGNAAITVHARHVDVPAIGIQNFNMLEKGSATGTNTFLGGNDDMLMTAKWMG